MTWFGGRLEALIQDEDGAAASEYAAVLAFVALVALVALQLFDISDIYRAVSTSVRGAVNNDL